MKRSVISRRICAAAVCLLLSIAPAACGGGGSNADGHTYVGTLKGTDAYVAIVADERNQQVSGYVTDGKGISIWIGRTALNKGVGTLVDRKDGKQVGVVAVAGGTAAGAIQLPNDDFQFEAEEATGAAGLYYKVERFGADLVAETGWIRLADGTYRGTRTTRSGSSGAGEPVGSPVGWASTIAGSFVDPKNEPA